MQTMLAVLTALREKNISVTLDEGTGNLRLKGNTGLLTAEDKQSVKRYKDDIIRFLTERKQERNISRYAKIPRTAVREAYPLSNAQRRIWILSQFPEANIAYNMPAAYELEGILNQEAIAYAFGRIVARHESLRTRFCEDEEGEVYQQIAAPEQSGFTITVKDMRNSADPGEEIRAFVQRDFYSPFDLAEGPLIRAALYRSDDEKWVLTCVMHHIVSDGWSMAVVMKEFLFLYTKYIKNDPADLPVPAIQYKDYVAWQLEQLTGQQYHTDKQYWLRQFEGELPVLEFPSWKVRPAVKTYRGATIAKVLDNHLYKGVKEITQQSGTTLFMTLNAAVTALLYHYTGQEDIIIGTPVAGREHEGLDGQVGFYVNTLALRMRFKKEDSYMQLLDTMRRVTLDGYAHQLYPFDDLVHNLSVKPDKSRNPLFDVMVLVQHYSAETVTGQQADGLKVSEYTHTKGVVSKFDMLFTFTERENDIRAEIQYNTDTCSADIIEQLCNHLAQLLHAIVETPAAPIEQLEYIQPAEKQKLLVDFNATGTDYDSGKTVIQLFEEQALSTPDNTALVFEAQTLTYKELNERTNQLGHYLRSLGVKEDTLVPVCIERGVEQIIAVLGILKAGGAYVPVDAEYPEERIRYMLEDTGADLVISSRQCREKIPLSAGIKLISVNDDREIISHFPVHTVTSARTNEHIVYVIYTSGSTGLPKGVKMPGKGLVNLLSWQEKQFENKIRRVMQFASLNFDVSFQEIFSTFCNGSALYLISAARRIDMHEVCTDIDTHRLTHLFMPYIVFNNLAEYMHTLPQLPHLPEQVIVAGEQLKLTAPITKLILSGGITLINHYGPTETHITTSYTINNNAPLPAWPPIGKPIANTRTYILRNGKFIVPQGVTGELYVSGVCLAQGYLNRQELTDAKFLNNPFEQGIYSRMYRTGDLARWLPDGNIEFLGRTDDQVKVRGFRVEPGEIETAIQQHPAVDAVVVLALPGKQGGKELVAYIAAHQQLTVTDMRNYLGQSLPAYMIPSFFVQLDSLPYNTNGKINKKMLPDPLVAGLSAGNEYEAPRNETEEKLARIWKALLGKDKVGVKDNFFELGGHSLQATQLIARIKKEFSVRINIQTLFNEPTIENISDHILFLLDQEQRMRNSEQLMEIDLL